VHVSIILTTNILYFCFFRKQNNISHSSAWCSYDGVLDRRIVRSYMPRPCCLSTLL